MTKPQIEGTPVWCAFDETKGSKQELPEPTRYVLLQIEEDNAVGMPPRVVVGYLKFAAGDRNSPQFITPGCMFETRKPLLELERMPSGRPVGQRITHWSDCLGDAWECPLWKGKQAHRKSKE